jgi:hypothetical protein
MISIEDVARVSLPNRGRQGMLSMLEFYLDDSGTHEDATVAVWGGIVGYKEFMSELADAWGRQLLSPCEGKPPIKAFHSSHLFNGWGEFQGYSPAEKDLTRRNFRKIIVDSGVTVLSYGISVADWKELVIGNASIVMGDAERAVFGSAIMGGCKAAKAEGQPISFQFDKGRDTPDLRSIIQPAIEVAEADGQFVSYGFSPVSMMPALQAADLVANETCQFFREYRLDEDARAGPHLNRLFEDAHDSAAGWIGREQIHEMVAGMSRVLARHSNEE